MNPKSLMVFDADLKYGDEVEVRWGYGLGFRAHGRGRIVGLYAKSVRVLLLEDVLHDGKVGWQTGFVLKGIPRHNWDTNSNDQHGVFPLTETAAVAV